MHFIPQIVLLLSFRVCSSEITIRTKGGLFEQNHFDVIVQNHSPFANYLGSDIWP